MISSSDKTLPLTLLTNNPGCLSLGIPFINSPESPAIVGIFVSS